MILLLSMNLPTVAAARLVDLDMAGYHIDSISSSSLKSIAQQKIPSVLIIRLLRLLLDYIRQTQDLDIHWLADHSYE